MLKVGITGGIGSGKSTVAGVFETLGIPVYHADTAAKKLMQEDAALQAAIVEAFGEAVYENGVLQRAKLASMVFNNKEKLALLNSIVHPATIADAERWMQAQKAPYVLKEAALLFESGSAEGLDYVIGVWAPEALRIKRVMARDKVSRNEVLQRMEHQIQENIKMRLCDFVIRNTEQELVVPQVLEIHRQLLALSKSSQTL